MLICFAKRMRAARHLVVFFFSSRRRHTRCSRDWSSDVCSSDLAHQFLVEEAALLDAADYAGWLGLLCEDIRYLMPVRVTTARGAGFDSLADMGHFDEDMYALRKRVQRLATDHAWTEDPPSRTRHFVTNVRTFREEAVLTTTDLRVESALLPVRTPAHPPA